MTDQPLDLDALLTATDQVGWWTMSRPDVETLVGEIRRLREQLGYQKDAIALLRAVLLKHLGDDAEVDREVARHLIARATTPAAPATEG